MTSLYDEDLSNIPNISPVFLAPNNNGFNLKPGRDNTNQIPHPLPYIVPVYFVQPGAIANQEIVATNDTRKPENSRPISYLEYLGDDLTLSQYNDIVRDMPNNGSERYEPHRQAESSNNIERYCWSTEPHVTNFAVNDTIVSTVSSNDTNGDTYFTDSAANVINAADNNFATSLTKNITNETTTNGNNVSDTNNSATNNSESNNSATNNSESNNSATDLNSPTKVTTSVSDTKQCNYCELCDVTFSRKSNLIRHIKSSHSSDNQTKFSCSKCGKQIKRYDNLVDHQKTCGSPSSTYKCTKCDKVFSRKRDLSRHISAVHDKTKPYQCKECEFTAAYKHLVRRHTYTTHRLESLYVCGGCEVDFVSQYRYNRHRRCQGPRESLTTCSICKTNFTNVNKLNLHMIKKHRHSKDVFMRGTVSGGPKIRLEDMIDAETPVDILPSMLLLDIANVSGLV